MWFLTFIFVLLILLRRQDQEEDDVVLRELADEEAKYNTKDAHVAVGYTIFALVMLQVFVGVLNRVLMEILSWKMRVQRCFKGIHKVCASASHLQFSGYLLILLGHTQLFLGLFTYEAGVRYVAFAGLFIYLLLVLVCEIVWRSKLPLRDMNELLAKNTG